MKLSILLFLILFILSSSNVNAINIQKEWHVYSNDSIQNAIDKASTGDIVYVHNGTYIENININISNLKIIGDSVDNVIVHALNPDSHTFHITANKITISGFTATGSYNCGYAGICIENANYCIVSNNSCFGNLCAGIYLRFSNYCIIENNNISNNDCGGLKLHNCNDNIIRGNWLENNLNMGIDVFGACNNNLIYNNYVDECRKNAIDSKYDSNIWNITKTSGINIIGGPYLGGNYWGDYNGVDNNNDGFGDMIYEIKDEPGENINNMDYLPLFKDEEIIDKDQNESPGFQVFSVIIGIFITVLFLKRFR